MDIDLRSHRFISHFPVLQGTELVKHVQLVRYPHKKMIFDEGTTSDCIYLVLTGRVELTKKSGGSPQLVAHKGPDDYFGELGVLDCSPRSTAAVADGPVLLGRLKQKPFLKILSESSWHTVLRLFSHISENLRETNARYVTEVVRKEKLTLMGEMANSMIHDFRSPFTTIRLVSESVAMRHSSDVKTQQLATTIIRQVDRLNGLMEEVLEFARGETKLRAQPVPLQEVFQQLLDNNQATFSQSSVRLVVKPTTAVLSLDANRFQRVLQNLINNAHEALADKKRAIITVTCKQLTTHSQITVGDNGPGIPEAIRSTLFEPFVSHGKSGGTGLGLAIARAVVEAHHGSISCRTSAKGTTFLIQLPLLP